MTKTGEGTIAAARGPVCVRCGDCGREFLTQTRLTWHIRKYHSVTTPPPSQADTREIGAVIVHMLCRCPDCHGESTFTFDWNSLPKWRACQACGVTMPFAAYRVIMHWN